MPTAASRPPRHRTRLLSLTVTVAIAAAGACGGDEAPSAARFCGEVEANKDALTNPQLASSDDIAPLLTLYNEIGALAPLAVSDDWEHLVSAYESASTVVLDDAASQQEALAAIYSAEKSAVAIDTWLRTNCAVDIGPVFTIVPQAQQPPAATPNDSAAP